MMTEEDAKTKWCPFARNPSMGTNREAVNRRKGGTPAPHTTCIASACMAWRWTKVANPDWKPDQQMAGYPPRNPFTGTPMYALSTTEGHCGLAGQP